MKKRILAVSLLITLVFVCQTIVYALPTSIQASATSVQAGNNITVSGTTTADAWVVIKGLDGGGNIVYFNAVLADISGRYTDSFKAPNMNGTLTLTSGSGTDTATAQVTVTAAAADNEGGGSAGSGDSSGFDFFAQTEKPTIPETGAGCSLDWFMVFVLILILI